MKSYKEKITVYNFSYSSAAVIFGVHLSARAAFRFEPPFAVRQESKIGDSQIVRNPALCVASYVKAIFSTL